MIDKSELVRVKVMCETHLSEIKVGEDRAE